MSSISIWLRSLRSRIMHENPVDLQGWRNWLVDVMIIFGLLIFPPSMVAFFPVFIAEKLYGLIALDICIFLALIIRFFTLGASYKYRGFFWLAVLYAMAITYLITLGPHYGRPGWLVMITVLSSLLFGVRGAVFSTGVNATILMLLYWLMGPENRSWTAEQAAPLGNWVMFIINLSILSLCSSLPVGFLLNRLDRSLHDERDAREMISQEREKLETAYSTLKAETVERKRAEVSLRESEEKYRSLVANATDAIFIVQDGRIKFPNPITLTLVGYSSEELTNLPFINLIHPEDRAMILDNYARRLKGEEVSNTYTFRVINKGGGELWGQLNAVLIMWGWETCCPLFY